MTTKNNIPAGYKDSAVGIIPQEWEVKRLGACFSIGHGRDYKNLSNGDIPVYGSGGIICYVGSFLHDGETVCIGRKGTINKPFYYNGPIWTVDTLFYTHNFQSVLPRYVGYLFDSIDWMRYNEATGVPSLTAKTISNIKKAVPPMEEQRKIAEILGVWDEAIEKQSGLIEKLELRKRALMQRLLTGRTRLPGFTTPWQKVKLGEIGKFDKGVGVPKEKIVSEGCKAITYGEIYTKYDYVIKDFASYIDSDTAQTSKQISSGAILFAGSGETLEDIGKCVAFIDNDKAYAGGDIIIFNPTIEVDSLVLSYILNSPIAIAQKRRYGQGHSVVHIYQKDLARIEFELPSLPEQKAIAEVLTAADNEIATHRKKLDALRLQKRGLMQQLLTGKTRVKI